MKNKFKPSNLLIGTLMASSFALASTTANAEANPFGATELPGGYMQIAGKEGSCGEGKCGGDKGKEASCGGDKAKKEGSCGEGKCGGDKAKKEGSCGGDKGKEGSCGDDKEKMKKGKEGSCGEGKCGGKKEG